MRWTFRLGRYWCIIKSTLCSVVYVVEDNTHSAANLCIFAVFSSNRLMLKIWDYECALQQYGVLHKVYILYKRMITTKCVLEYRITGRKSYVTWPDLYFWGGGGVLYLTSEECRLHWKKGWITLWCHFPAAVWVVNWGVKFVIPGNNPVRHCRLWLATCVTFFLPKSY